jgi:membrane protein implicated in regulation of membrane protease activity
MNWSEIYLICFGVGSLWSLASLLMGGLHLGHGAHGHAHAGHGHAHVGHTAHTAAHAHGHAHSSPSSSNWADWLGTLLSPACIAVFLAWFGGIGYLLTRHSALGTWADLAIAVILGCLGAFLLGWFLRWIQSHEQPLEATDTDLVGMLGRVSCVIRPTGVGEMIFVRDGSRRAIPARSEDGKEIPRDEEVVVTRYEKGIAFVRTWAALTQPDAESTQSGNSARGDSHVE